MKNYENQHPVKMRGEISKFSQSSTHSHRSIGRMVRYERSDLGSTPNESTKKINIFERKK